MKITEAQSAELFAGLEDTLQVFIDKAALFTPKQFNTVPYKDSWTPGQAAQHVLMSVTGFTEVINGAIKETLRAPDAGVAQIKADFLNFDIKMQSPDFVLPEKKEYDQQKMLNALKSIKSQLLQSVKTLDLNPTCTSFEIPGAGMFTRFEATSFVRYHTQRHIHQLKKMHIAIAGDTANLTSL